MVIERLWGIRGNGREEGKGCFALEDLNMSGLVKFMPKPRRNGCRLRRMPAEEADKQEQSRSPLQPLDPQTPRPQPAWYCARTKPKREHAAATNLGKRLGLEVFQPWLRLERATRRGVVRLVEPLFPGYIFVRCIPERHSAEIRQIAGISSLVHFGRKTPAMPDGAIVELRHCFESEEPAAVGQGSNPASDAKIVEGVFMDFSETVVRASSGEQRVQLLLDFLGHLTLADVDTSLSMMEERRIIDLMPFLTPPGNSGLRLTTSNAQ